MPSNFPGATSALTFICSCHPTGYIDLYTSLSVSLPPSFHLLVCISASNYRWRAQLCWRSFVSPRRQLHLRFNRYYSPISPSASPALDDGDSTDILLRQSRSSTPGTYLIFQSIYQTSLSFNVLPPCTRVCYPSDIRVYTGRALVFPIAALTIQSFGNPSLRWRCLPCCATFFFCSLSASQWIYVVRSNTTDQIRQTLLSRNRSTNIKSLSRTF